MKRILFLATVFAAAPAGAAWMMGNVAITDLGTLGGPDSEACDINASGQIVGWSDTVSGPRNAFRYQNGTMSHLIPALASWYTQANGINDAGIVVGFHKDPTRPDDPAYAFRWTNGLTFSLAAGFAPDGMSYSTWAEDITNSGRIAGTRNYPGGSFDDPILWQANYQFVDLQSVANPPGSAKLFHTEDVNDAGDVVAWADDDGPPYLFRWSGNLLAKIKLPAPAPPPGMHTDYGHGYGINDSGHVVGYGLLSGNGTGVHRATFWDGVSLYAVMIGVLPGGNNSYAKDVNRGGFIIGWSQANDQLPPPLFSPTYIRAFLYHKDFGMKALPTLAAMAPYSECRPNALNERKSTGVLEVVGFCRANGVMHAVRWTVNIYSVR
jgi:probable HAF family extracellular repeat protein